MPTIVPGFEHDIFISYRHNDNLDGWVTTFVDRLQKELRATIKDPISVYFDTNPHDGLNVHHDVDDSLREKLKCKILIPIVSRTYCDTNSFAWKNEFQAFVNQSRNDPFGLKVKLPNGNVASRVLPLRIHDIDKNDESLFESVIGSVMRPIDLIYKSAGVNRPLLESDKKEENNNNTQYRDQINMVANAIDEILKAIKGTKTPELGSHPISRTVDPMYEDEPSMDEKLIRKLNKAVEDNLGNELFSVEDLAEEVAYSRSYLHRKLQRLRGVSISQFIRGIRLQHGLELLKKDVGTVSEIAYRVGFSSNTYFTKCFTEHFGFPPGEAKSLHATKTIVKESQVVTAEITNEVAPVSSSPSPLEVLHPAASETLIREVFTELVRHKPELEKFISVNEEEGESVDIRLLAYQIIKSYPFPIGVELRRLFAGTLLNHNQERNKQVVITIDRCTKFIVFIVFNELTNRIHEGKLTLGANTSKDLAESIGALSMAQMVKVIKSASEAMEKSESEYFVDDLPTILDASFFREMNEVVNLLNKPDQPSSEKYADLEQALIFLLKKTSFLVKYRMVNVDSIEVNKARYKLAHFEHHLHILNSTSTELKVHKELLNQFSDSKAVLLMKSIKEPDQFLNLSPFVIDTHGENVQTKDKKKYKKDIYLFDGFVNDTIKYNGVESCTEDDLSLLEKYDVLVNEFKELLNLIRT